MHLYPFFPLISRSLRRRRYLCILARGSTISGNSRGPIDRRRVTNSWTSRCRSTAPDAVDISRPEIGMSRESINSLARYIGCAARLCGSSSVLPFALFLSAPRGFPDRSCARNPSRKRGEIVRLPRTAGIANARRRKGCKEAGRTFLPE